MIDILWQTFLLLGALAGLGLCVRLFRSPVPVLAVVVFFVTVQWEFPNPPPLLSIAGNSVFALDVVCLLLAAHGAEHWARHRNALPGIWAAFLGCCVVSLVGGLLAFESGAVVNEFRAFLYPAAFGLWSTSRGRHLSRKHIIAFAFSLGWLLVLAAAYHAAKFGLGGASDFVVTVDSEVGQTLRPLTSGQALMLMACTFLVGWSTSRWRTFSILAFTVALLLSQQRTVWVASIVAAASLILAGTWAVRRKILVAGFFAALLLAITLSGGAFGSIVGMLRDSTTNLGTYDGRVASWYALLNQATASGPGAILFGQPFGSGYGRYEGAGRWVEFAPHNWYLTVFLRTGIIGLALMAALLIALIVEANRRRHELGPIPLALVLALAVYGWSYSWTWYAVGCMLLVPRVTSAFGTEQTGHLPNVTMHKPANLERIQ